MEVDNKEKRKALSLDCANRDKCDDQHCVLFTDAEIDALYDHYISLFKMRGQSCKADAGKLPMNLVPTQIDRDIAQVRQYGNEKYGDPNNWRKVDKIRYVAALERHLLAYKDYLNGDDDGLDKESGIEHYKHMACNMAFICEMERWEKKE